MPFPICANCNCCICICGKREYEDRDVPEPFSTNLEDEEARLERQLGLLDTRIRKKTCEA